MFNIITKIYRLLNQNDYNFYNIIKYYISNDNSVFYVDKNEDYDGYLADNEENDKINENKNNIEENISNDEENISNDEENISNDEDNIMIDGLELLFIDILK